MRSQGGARGKQMTDFKQHNSQLIRIVGEDLRYLLSRGESLAEDALRRDSVVLRRLLVDEDFARAWKLAKLEGRPVVAAPRLEDILDHKYLGTKVNLALAGGGQYFGICAALGILYEGHVEQDLLEFSEHTFALEEFSRSTAIYAGGKRVSRAEVIQYVANKLGGAHFSTTRKSHHESFEALDRHLDRFYIEGIPGLVGINAVYFELLSICQLLGRSDAALKLVRAIS
jgi:hypothetical protein